MSKDSIVYVSAERSQLDKMSEKHWKLSEDILKNDEIENLITIAITSLFKEKETKITDARREIRY